jgi:predicted DNA-binding transcriptional regulator YafY
MRPVSDLNLRQSGPMANTSARMLRLLSLLQTHRYWPGAELADRLDVSARTLRRDVDRLRELGYPVDAARGVAGGYQLQAGAAVPPLLLDDEEAVAIAVGLRSAAAGAVAGFEETSVRALAKVIQLLPPRLRRRIDALQAATSPGGFGGGPTIDATVLTTIAMACRGEERLRFDYTTRGGDAATRHVEPHRLVSLGRRWYLVAWDLDRADWRSFRVDRLGHPAVTGARFRPREIPGGDVVAWMRDRLAVILNRYEVSVLVHAPAPRVAAVVTTWASVEPVSDETCRLRMNVDDLGWPVMVLGVVGADFTIESPSELRDGSVPPARSCCAPRRPDRSQGDPLRRRRVAGRIVAASHPRQATCSAAGSAASTRRLATPPVRHRGGRLPREVRAARGPTAVPGRHPRSGAGGGEPDRPGSGGSACPARMNAPPTRPGGAGSTCSGSRSCRRAPSWRPARPDRPPVGR